MAKRTEDISKFDALPDTALLRVQAVCELLGASTSTCWRWARTGRLPRPVKIGPQATRWRVGDLRKHIATLNPDTI